MSGASECRGNKRRKVKVSKAGGALEKRIKFKKLASVKPEERQARSCLEKAKVKDRARKESANESKEVFIACS